MPAAEPPDLLTILPNAARNFFLAALALVVVLLVSWCVLASRSGFAPEGSDAARAKARYETVATLKTEAAKATTEYAWLDKAKGAVVLPLDRAMEVALPELAQQKQKPSAMPVVPPAAPATAAPAAPAPAPAAAAPAAPAPAPAAAAPAAPASTPAPDAPVTPPGN